MNHPFPNTRNEKLAASSDATRAHSRLRKQNRLGEKLWLFGKGRGKKEAKAPAPIPVTAAMPTKQRLEVPLPKTPEEFASKEKADAQRGKDLQAAWGTDTHPGGQVSYRAKSAVDVYKEHFTDDLVHAADELMKDADLCTKANLICARTYTGMPYAVSKASLTTDQIDAQARFKWIMGGMDERFRAAVAFLVMGVRSERMGAPRDFAYTASRYRDPTTKNAFTAGFLKAVLIRVKEGQMAYAAHLRWRKEQIAAQRRETKSLK